MQDLTLIVPFYRNCAMLAEQVRNWNFYPESIRIILVDDGSPEEAFPIVMEHATPETLARLEVYRINQDIPWNRGGARNLGAKRCNTAWMLHIDIDHILPPHCAEILALWHSAPVRWYRFPRYRRGRADETRLKDAIPESQDYGQIHPHVDSYLCTRDMYWKAGGYNEDFSGCLGGGSPFLKYLEQVGGKPYLMPADIFLEVYTRSTIADASDHTLSRDKTAFTLRKLKLKGQFKGHNPIRFTWNKVL